MSKLKTTRGRLSQEQKDFLINNNEMTVAKLQTAFRRRFKRNLSITNLTNFYRKNEVKNKVSKKSIRIMKPKAWSMDENKFIIVDDNNNKVEIDINVFGQDFVKNLFTYKKQAEQKRFNKTIQFWNKL
tara:strand:+ start:680 stop:1063 length:384 start_codon:yes stop_codon:yes gene_type:complete